MCSSWQSSTLAVTDAYWLMRQWRSRVKQERPIVTEMQLKKMLCRWHIARWRRNMDNSQIAITKLSNAIVTHRIFHEEAKIREVA